MSASTPSPTRQPGAHAAWDTAATAASCRPGGNTRGPVRELGWFDVERKKPLPLLPRRIAVVTSAGGAGSTRSGAKSSSRSRAGNSAASAGCHKPARTRRSKRSARRETAP